MGLSCDEILTIEKKKTTREELYAKTNELARVKEYPNLPCRKEIEKNGRQRVRVGERGKIFHVNRSVQRHKLRHCLIDSAGTGFRVEEFRSETLFDVRLNEMERHPQRIDAHVAWQQFPERDRVRLHLQTVIPCR